jgi:hypothetical protein
VRQDYAARQGFIGFVQDVEANSNNWLQAELEAGANVLHGAVEPVSVGNRQRSFCSGGSGFSEQFRAGHAEVPRKRRSYV